MARSPRSDGAGADILRRLREFQKSIRTLSPPEAAVPIARQTPFLAGAHGEILVRLRQQSPSLADSLVQALTDLHDPNRLTYVGPAGEALGGKRGAVQMFAPNEANQQQPGGLRGEQGGATEPWQA